MKKEEPQFTACGQRLRECRVANRQTMEEVAVYLRVNKSKISRWENGHTQKIPLSVIERLAHLWHVSPVWLMGSDVEKYILASTQRADANNAVVEAITELTLKLSDSDQRAVLGIIQAIADKYPQDSG